MTEEKLDVILTNQQAMASQLDELWRAMWTMIAFLEEETGVGIIDKDSGRQPDTDVYPVGGCVPGE